jgi:hypothetical protein
MSQAPFTPAYRAELDQIRAEHAEAWAESVRDLKKELDNGQDPAEAFRILYHIGLRDLAREMVATAFACAMLRDAQAAQAATAGSPR